MKKTVVSSKHRTTKYHSRNFRVDLLLRLKRYVIEHHGETVEGALNKALELGLVLLESEDTPNRKKRDDGSKTQRAQA